MIKQPAAAVSGLLRNMMDSASSPAKDYVHYQHTDACSLSRWTARESYQFMYSRPWQKVNDFYLDVVNGCRSLSDLFGKEPFDEQHGADGVKHCDKLELVRVPGQGRTGRWARVTFRIVLSYHGNSFDGWQKQPGLNTVQGLIERSLGKFIDEKKAQLLKEKKLPLDACAVVAGRTDKGVTALNQVCSFYTWRTDIKALDIEEAVNHAAPGKIRAVSVSQVSREFHPNFSATWRRYLYIFPISDENVDDRSGQCIDSDGWQDGKSGEHLCEDNGVSEIDDFDQSEQQSGNKPLNFEVSRVNHLLQKLEGKLLSFRMFARDTKPARNIGPPTECFLFHARAAEARLLNAKDGISTRIMCIELVANRFLRKMVRVLVATAIREAAAGAEEDALLKLMDATCRRATAPPAPPDGLCLVDVGYNEFDKGSCLIP
ncbi:Pseudouridine synthase family protein [Striga hermonthica]|uniref:tRNA pseudouridine synthase n=1 Tax=Striga hermonthica TaxID=68872 RepID=A0A9N7N310_STRHE|nr:Pseudouridine synthase family protein [Striga hermonthica]